MELIYKFLPNFSNTFPNTNLNYFSSVITDIVTFFPESPLWILESPSSLFPGPHGPLIYSFNVKKTVKSQGTDAHIWFSIVTN